MRRVIDHGGRRGCETHGLRGRRWLDELGWSRRDDGSRLSHLDYDRLGWVGKFHIREFDLGRLNFNDRRLRELGNYLRLDGLGFDLLYRDGLDQRGELVALVDGLLRGCADDDGDERDDDIERYGGKERTLALVSVVQNAEVSELHILRCGIFTAQWLYHKTNPSKDLLSGGRLGRNGIRT